MRRAFYMPSMPIWLLDITEEVADLKVKYSKIVVMTLFKTCMYVCMY